MATHGYKKGDVDAVPGYRNEINGINLTTATVSKRSSDAQGEKGVFRAILLGWFQGLTGTDEVGDIRRHFFDQKWNPRPGCPLKEFNAIWDSTLPYGRRQLSVIASSRDVSASNVTRATTKFTQALKEWASNITQYVNNSACDLQFLRGASNLGEAILPYRASLWSKPEYKLLMKKEYFKMIRSQILSRIKSNTKRMMGAGYSADIDFIRVSTRAYGELVRDVFTPLIAQAKPSLDLEKSPGVMTALKLLQKFITPRRGPSAISDLSNIFAQASKLNMAKPVVSWRYRPLGDVFHHREVRKELRNITVKEFSHRTFIGSSDAKKTNEVPNRLPDYNDDGSKTVNLAVGGELGVEDLATPAPAPVEFNWFTDDTRANYQDCVLDKASSQGFCAACWSFAATAMLDYRLCGLLKRNNLKPLANPVVINRRAYRSGETKLSNQICLSCTRNGDCNGGAPSDCLDWVKNNGLVSQACQPYRSWKLYVNITADAMVLRFEVGANNGKLQCPAVGRCEAGGADNMRGNVVTALQTGYVTGLDNVRAALQSGPVTLIMSTPASFIAWGGKMTRLGFPIPDGIFSSEGNPKADRSRYNHVITVFGYGQEMVGGKTRKFFLCLNSWGSLYNPFFFRGMWFNMEENNKGPWFKLDAEDPALELDKYPAYWATPGLRVGGQVVPVNGKGQDGKPYWK